MGSRHLTPRELSDRAAAGLRHVWRTQCGYIAGGEVAEHDGILITATRLPDVTLNCAFLTAPPADAQAALDWCAGWFHDRGRRAGIELRAGDHPEVEAALRRRGFEVVVRRPAMTLHPLPDTPAQPHVTRVEDEGDLVAFQVIQGIAFDMTPEVTAAFVPPAALTTPGLTLFLARHEGVAAASAAVSISPYGAGIVGVSTLPAYRRRGLGAAVTKAAIKHAYDSGADLAWLYPSPMARSLYERLGFRALDDVQVWAEPR